MTEPPGGRGARPGGPTPPRAVVLDCLGTLLELESPAPRLRGELVRRGIDVPEGAAEAAFGAEIDYYLEHHLEGRDRESLERLRDACAAVTAEALGVGRERLVPVRAALLAAISFAPLAGVTDALRALRAAGLRLVVTSNWDCSLPAVLADAGLRSLVDGVVTSAEVGVTKPARQIFETALEVAGCGPEEAVCVGDSLEHDVAGARAAGIEAILIVHPGAGADPDADVTVARCLGEARSLILARG